MMNIYLQLINQAGSSSSTKLFFFGQESETVPPSHIAQGFRIGAKKDDKLFVDFSAVIKEAKILMDNGSITSSVSSVKEIEISTQSSGTFTSPSNHLLSTGEKVIVISDDGDLPENIEEKTVTLETSQDERSELKLIALLNMFIMFTTLETSQADKSPLNRLAIRKVISIS